MNSGAARNSGDQSRGSGCQYGVSVTRRRHVGERIQDSNIPLVENDLPCHREQVTAQHTAVVVLSRAVSWHSRTPEPPGPAVLQSCRGNPSISGANSHIPFFERVCLIFAESLRVTGAIEGRRSKLGVNVAGDTVHNPEDLSPQRLGPHNRASYIC